MNASTPRLFAGILVLFVNLFPAIGLAQTPNPCPNSPVTMQRWDGVSFVQVCGQSADPISMAIEAKAASGLLRATQFPSYGIGGYGVDPTYAWVQSQNAVAAYNLAAELREAMVSQVAASSFEDAVRNAEAQGRADGQHAAVMRGLGEVRADIVMLRNQIVAAEVRTRRELASAISSGNDNLRRDLEARMSGLQIARQKVEARDPDMLGFFHRLFNTPNEPKPASAAPPTSTTPPPPTNRAELGAVVSPVLVSTTPMKEIR